MPIGPSIEQSDGAVLLRVRVQPKASRNEVRFESDGQIRVSLTAPPHDGKANKALRSFMAKTLGVPQSAIRLVHGAKSREKTLEVKGASADSIRVRLSNSDPRKV